MTLLSDRLALAAARGEGGSPRSPMPGARCRARSSPRPPRRSRPPAPTLLAGPTYDSGWVRFPVGGGPGVVSASHTHHDYPAVDIAAPLGSPVYAMRTRP